MINETTPKTTAEHAMDFLNATRETTKKYYVYLAADKTCTENLTPKGRVKKENKKNAALAHQEFRAADAKKQDARKNFVDALYGIKKADTESIENRRLTTCAAIYKALGGVQTTRVVTGDMIHRFTELANATTDLENQEYYRECVKDYNSGRNVTMEVTQAAKKILGIENENDAHECYDFEHGLPIHAYLNVFFDDLGYVHRAGLVIERGAAKLINGRNGPRHEFHYRIEFGLTLSEAMKLNFPAYGSETTDFTAVDAACRILMTRVQGILHGSHKEARDYYANHHALWYDYEGLNDPLIGVANQIVVEDAKGK